jgi:cytochrome P450
MPAAERTLEDGLTAILASDPAAMADPFPAWRQLREAGPALRMGPRVLVSRHEDVKSLVRDKSGLSSRAFIEGSQAEAIFARLSPEQRRAHLEVSAFEEKYVSRSDGAAHTRLRAIAHHAFTPRRIAAMEQAVQRYTDVLLDELSAHEDADFVSGLAYRLPLMVIADMLGVEGADRELIHEWSSKLGRNRGGENAEALMEAHAAMVEFRAYVEAVIAAKRGAPPDSDLVTALMQAHEGDSLSAEEMAAMFVILLFAGHETTTNLLANGLVELHRHPDQWRLLCDELPLARSGVEELLRFVSPVQWLVRVAVEPVELDGFDIAADETVFLILAAANRDPRRFHEPDRLDLLRADATQHIALGFGPHFCLGNALARLEGAVTFGTLARRFPDMEVETENLAWGGNAKLRALRSLPVSLGRPRAGVRS